MFWGFFFPLSEVWLIYNVVFLSGVQHSDLVIHICLTFFRFFPIMVYYRMLIIVPFALQSVLVGYLLYI